MFDLGSGRAEEWRLGWEERGAAKGKEKGQEKTQERTLSGKTVAVLLQGI